MLTCCQMLSNFIAGREKPSASTSFLPVINPSTGKLLAEVPLSTQSDLDDAVNEASKASVSWAKVPIKERVQVFFRLKTILEREADAIADCIHKENGKTHAEAKASLLRGIECVEFACSLPQIAGASVLEVSSGVECKELRFPLGVVAGIAPFNFPIMIPLWMIPTAIGMGNSFILKPSEQTPLTSMLLAEYLKEAGLPDGVFSVVHGGKEIVEAMSDHPKIAAIGFVGSSQVAQAVYSRVSSSGKRVRALGGAKNHLVLMPDADSEISAKNIVASVAGCCGQRCMAASVLLAVGETDSIIQSVLEKLEAIEPGKDIGPLINQNAVDRINNYLNLADSILVDGRKKASGLFMGASLIEVESSQNPAARDEIFGPVLTLIRCKSLEDALEIENACPYGNAAAIYTSSGAFAHRFTECARSGMIGVNIGVPVPREPFPFGGWGKSRIGDGDLTGMAGIEFWSRSKKVTTKWAACHGANWMS